MAKADPPALLGDEAALREGLPPQLRERLRVAKGGQLSRGPVLYWMRSALRGHENPALDAAISAANALRVPLLILLHIEDRYPCATARRQMFLLQGAQGAAKELRRRHLHVYVQVDQRACRPLLQRTFSERASLVVTEEPFCVPWLAGVESLLRDSIRPALWLLDCSSVVPSACVPPSACHRAYVYEQATRQLHAERLAQPWRDVVLECLEAPDVMLEGVVPSIDILGADLDEFLRGAEVDMYVLPVQHTLGGSVAGYIRWSNWLSSGGLKTYAKRRNDSLDVSGVSRMSGYLNAGMVSPMRIAREANAASGAGKSKFLHEFLTWRGIAYAYCYHFPMPSSGATLEQLPSWAQETLRRHAADPRTVIPLMRLAAGESGDLAWDGMQRYLVETGELHNNARMGWGKAIAKWSKSPEAALAALIELNNRFALDGHAPPSYGGLLGCLGLFEGPKAEGKVLGRVAYKPPKARYAAMASLAGELRAATLWPGSHGSGRDCLSEGGLRPSCEATLADGQEAVAAQSATEVEHRSVKRRWVRKLQVEPGGCIDLA